MAFVRLLDYLFLWILARQKTVLLYVYAKDDEGYRNLLKMSSAVAVRDSETLPLQWLKAYSCRLYHRLSIDGCFVEWITHARCIATVVNELR